MRIAICGVPRVGKTDLARKIAEIWPSYECVLNDDPRLRLESRFDISKLDGIMDMFVDRAQFADGKKNVIHDGCILDALAHIYMFFGMNEGANDSILAKYHGLMYAAIQYYDAIFYVPYRTKFKRDVDEITKDEFLYLTKLDEFYGAIFDEWKKGNSAMFPFKSSMGCPPIIEVFGTTTEDQMHVVELYLDDKGDAIPPKQKSADSNEKEDAENKEQD